MSQVKPKTYQQIMNDMLGSILTTGTQPHPLGPQQQGQLTVAPAQMPSGQYHISSSGTTLTQQQLSQLLQQFQTGLTADEKKEMQALNEAHTSNIKVEKLNLFKKLPTDLRQFVINFFLWQETVQLINQIIPVKSDRLQELEQKDANGRLFSSQAVWSSGSVMSVSDFHIPTQLPLPEGISIDDLKQAHLEATMEEELLDGEKES